MPAMVYTTLSAAVALGDKVITVASATGITGRANGAATTLLYVDFELMEVDSVVGTFVFVKRGISPTQQTAHLTASKVWVGPPGAFLNGDPSGAVNTTDAGIYYPAIVPATRQIWDIIGGLWVRSEVVAPSTTVNIGAAAASVTAAEYGDAFRHQTKLTFTAFPVGTPVAAANLAIGALIYTFPAGNIMIEGCNVSVALADVEAHAHDVANTPNLGVGLLIGSGAQATLNGVGATCHNYLAEAAVAGCAAAYTSTYLASSVAKVALTAALAHTVYLNAACNWTEHGIIKAAGTVVLNWTFSPV